MRPRSPILFALALLSCGPTLPHAHEPLGGDARWETALLAEAGGAPERAVRGWLSVASRACEAADKAPQDGPMDRELRMALRALAFDDVSPLFAAAGYPSALLYRIDDPDAALRSLETSCGKSGAARHRAWVFETLEKVRRDLGDGARAVAHRAASGCIQHATAFGTLRLDEPPDTGKLPVSGWHADAFLTPIAPQRLEGLGCDLPFGAATAEPGATQSLIVDVVVPRPMTVEILAHASAQYLVRAGGRTLGGAHSPKPLGSLHVVQSQAGTLRVSVHTTDPTATARLSVFGEGGSPLASHAPLPGSVADATISPRVPAPVAQAGQTANDAVDAGAVPVPSREASSSSPPNLSTREHHARLLLSLREGRLPPNERSSVSTELRRAFPASPHLALEAILPADAAHALGSPARAQNPAVDDPTLEALSRPSSVPEVALARLLWSKRLGVLSDERKAREAVARVRSTSPLVRWLGLDDAKRPGALVHDTCSAYPFALAKQCVATRLLSGQEGELAPLRARGGAPRLLETTRWLATHERGDSANHPNADAAVQLLAQEAPQEFARSLAARDSRFAWLVARADAPAKQLHEPTRELQGLVDRAAAHASKGIAEAVARKRADLELVYAAESVVGQTPITPIVTVRGVEIYRGSGTEKLSAAAMDGPYASGTVLASTTARYNLSAKKRTLERLRDHEGAHGAEDYLIVARERQVLPLEFQPFVGHMGRIGRTALASEFASVLEVSRSLLGGSQYSDPVAAFTVDGELARWTLAALPRQTPPWRPHARGMVQWTHNPTRAQFALAEAAYAATTGISARFGAFKTSPPLPADHAARVTQRLLDEMDSSDDGARVRKPGSHAALELITRLRARGVDSRLAWAESPASSPATREAIITPSRFSVPLVVVAAGEPLYVDPSAVGKRTATKELGALFAGCRIVESDMRTPTLLTTRMEGEAVIELRMVTRVPKDGPLQVDASLVLRDMPLFVAQEDAGRARARAFATAVQAWVPLSSEPTVVASVVGDALVLRARGEFPRLDPRGGGGVSTPPVRLPHRGQLVSPTRGLRLRVSHRVEFPSSMGPVALPPSVSHRDRDGQVERLTRVDSTSVDDTVEMRAAPGIADDLLSILHRAFASPLVLGPRTRN